MHKYVIMGIQGSGKSTQAKLLRTDYDLTHISVGDILRWNVEQHTKLGAHVRRTMASGQLVEDDLVESIVSRRLAEHDWNYGFIIDGFPRNVRQAEFFLESYDLDAVILLELADEKVAERIEARRVCASCGLESDARSGETRCDACGGELKPRSDDTPEALAQRLRDYHEKTRPIIELFARKEFVLRVDASGSIEDVQSEIRARLKLTS